LPRALGPRGLALFEIQPDQAEAVGEAARRVLPGAQVQVRRDLAGLERLVAVSRVE
jgi:methylase of polypeptide subunit release factors